MLDGSEYLLVPPGVYVILAFKISKGSVVRARHIIETAHLIHIDYITTIDVVVEVILSVTLRYNSHQINIQNFNKLL